MSKSNETTPNVPTLRFSNKTIWEKKRIKDFCEVNPKTEELEDEFIYIDLESVSKGCLLSENIISKTNAPSRAQRVLKNNDILFQCVRPYQMNNLLFNAENADFQYVASTGYAQIRTQENSSFVYQLLHSPKFNKEVMLRCTGSSYPAISSSDLEDIEVYICGVEEQQKIGYFLDLIDRRIAVQNKIISDLKVLKKELCNKVFGKGSAVRLGDFIEEVTTRNKSNSCENVLSVSNKMGFIKQSEQFEDRTVASENKSNYKVVTEGCFAYNPARINVGSIALLSTYKIGIISPMYVCFKTKSNLNSEYLNFYYQSGFFYKELQKKLEGSVRQCLTYENMSEILIPYVGIEEQKAIAVTLNKFATLIATEEKYIKSLQKQKSYFLNAMFI